MEMVLTNGFCEMTQDEVMSTDGGSILGTVVAVVTIGSCTFDITVGGIIGAIGLVWSVSTAAGEIYDTFF